MKQKLKNILQLILIILLVVLASVLGGCAEEPEHNHNDFELYVINVTDELHQTNIELNQKIILLQQQIETLEKEQNATLQQTQKQFEELQLMLETTEIYGFDTDGNFITFIQLGNMLSTKYFDNRVSKSTLTYDENIIYFEVEVSMLANETLNHVYARFLLLLDEFTQYDLYNRLRTKFVMFLTITNVELYSIEIETALFENYKFTASNVDQNSFGVTTTFLHNRPNFTEVDRIMKIFIENNTFNGSVFD